ncbi:hypothetical protein WSM22_10460 [Cytophagales bacterium WSM2-2]|nr:hypothetical protein WSM22_10460 [Cytophagales bacterium WSM2-2]
MGKKITIGITDCSKYANYEKWIREDGIDVIKLDHSNFDEVKNCNGVLISGGEDVHPSHYGKPEYVELCEGDFNLKRDEFELKVISFALENRMPLLGICRGLQLTNVYFGGTLIPDLPSFGKFNHSRLESKDHYHSVSVNSNSLLFDITQTEQGEINSSHHQSADRVGKGLVCSAISPDGVVEAIEKQKRDDPFFLLVQWHPERMINQNNPLTKSIRDTFLKSVKKI